MRLLNVLTFKLEEFIGDQIPPYAILSHTWETEEPTIEDVQDLNEVRLTALTKIQYCFKQARLDRIDYVWLDTCCIDKRSSAELTEAINSMYSWYESANVCYAFLPDVQVPEDHLPPGDDTPESFPTNLALELRLSQSRWFTRGWTLQELLAPKHIKFFGHNWTYFGMKTALVSTLSRTSGIDMSVLKGNAPLYGICAARKMSWAAKRQTTRIEDEAYCLLGIFAVNMPMLYGEGRRAFLRLQEHILANSVDQSLLAW
ncbi:HET-domain-containing protein, partial [Rhizodiscina lignyota]